MWKTDVYRLGIKTMVIVAVSAMVFAVFAGMNTQNVKAEDFEGNVQVSGDYGYEPDIAVDSTGNIYVVWEHYGIWCKNSTDYGANFGTAIFVSGTDLYCDYPSIAVDDNDNLHVAWIGSGDYIYYAKSTDHGASFSTPVKVSETKASGIDRTGIVAYGNNVYIVWRTYEGYNLSLSRSINGAAFEDIKVNEVDGSVSGDPAIAIGTGEIIYVVWQASGGRTRIATSINQGASFGVSVRVDDMGDFSTYHPSVAAIGTSTVYVAWGDTDSGRLRVSKSIDSGASFGSSVIVSDADVLGDIWSSIAVHPCGKIFVAWAYDKTSGDDIGMEIYFANSTDEGGSFGTNIKVNDEPPIWDHKYPSLAVGNDTEVYVAWKDHRGDHNRIWFSKAPDATWPSKITDLDAVDATANSITLNWTAPGDNFDLGTAAEYDIRYSTSDITETNWADATQVEGEIEPNITETHESFEVTGLGNDTLYYFAIKTLDERNNTAPLSKVVSRKTLATTKINHPPYAPTLTEPANDTWITTDRPTFNWTFNDQDEGDIQTLYWVQINATLDWTVPQYDSGLVSGELLPYTPITAISDGIWYWRVRTWDNHDAWSNWSNPWIVKIDTTPPTTVTLEEPADVTKNSVTLTWSKNTDSDFKQYEIYKDSELVTTITDRNTTTYTVPDLSSGTTYYFKIRVVDNAGLSADSTQVSATTSALPGEEMNWLLIGGIIGIVVVIVVILIAVIMVKKKKGKTPENP